MQAINPYQGVNWSNQQKAHLHTHTNQQTIGGVVYGSDGGNTTQAVIDMYANKGYKILAITDHDNVSSVTTYPWTIFSRDPVTLGMLSVEGKEILNNGHHMNSYFNDTGVYADYNDTAGALALIQSKGGVAVLNHPGRYTKTISWYTDLYLAYPDTLIGLEVYNYGNYYPNDRKTWDLINAVTIPQGKVVYGTSNDDYHRDNPFRNYQFILSNTISETDIKTALKNGKYYSCLETGGTGNALAPKISNIVVDNTQHTITLMVDSGTVTWITEGTVTVGTGNVFDFTTFDKSFVRAEITNSYGTTLTQPFRIVLDSVQNKPYDYVVQSKYRKSEGIWQEIGDTYAKISGIWQKISDIKARAIVNTVPFTPIEKPTIVSVDTIPDISVANGTTLNEAGLPASIWVTMSDNTRLQKYVVWNNGNPSYSSTTAGTYTFTGDVSDTLLTASIKVIVAQAVISEFTPKYFVDSVSGSDSNDGLSETTPWKTLSKVYSKSYSAGDVIALKRGSVWREQLSMSTSGTATDPVVYTAYGTGAKPKICANDVVNDWTTESGLYFHGGSYAASIPYSVTKNGTLMQNVGTKTEVVAGKWWFDSTNKRVYISDDPSINTIEMSALNRTGVSTSGKINIILDNLDIEGCGRSLTSALRLDVNATNVTIQNCDLHETYYGINTSSSTGSNNLIYNNHIYNCYCNGFSSMSNGTTGWILRGNEIDHCGYYSSQLLGSLYPQGIFAAVKSMVVEYNKIHDIMNPKGPGYSHGIYTGGGPHIVRYNEFYNSVCSGVKLMSKDDLVYYNVIHQCEWGVEVEGAVNTTIYNNTIYDCGCGVRAVTGYNEIAGSIKSMRNNIIFDCYTNSGVSPSNILVFPNSVVYDADNNLMWSSMSTDVGYYQGQWINFAEWQALGFDSHGINSDPKVINAEGADFHLQASSPCINTGVSVGLNKDYDGNAISGLPNIGAYE